MLAQVTVGPAAPEDARPVANRDDGEDDPRAVPTQEVEEGVRSVDHATGVATPNEDDPPSPILDHLDHEAVEARLLGAQFNALGLAQAIEEFVRGPLAEEKKLLAVFGNLVFPDNGKFGLEAPVYEPGEALGGVALRLAGSLSEDDGRLVGYKFRQFKSSSSRSVLGV